MRVVVQRVNSAKVEVNSKIVGEIGTGLLIYSGFEKGDSEKEINFMAEKLLNFRIFPDESEKMTKSILDIPEGMILSISQFTLTSFIKKGRRPDFSNALEPEKAKQLYILLNKKLSESKEVKEGIFGAMMNISSVNSGPVTFIIEKKFNNI